MDLPLDNENADLIVSHRSCVGEEHNVRPAMVDVQDEWDNLIVKPAREAERTEAALIRIAEHIGRRSAAANQETALTTLVTPC